MTVVAFGALLVGSGPAGAADEVRPIVFPVEGKVTYTDTFGAPRVGHVHQGQDLMGAKLLHLLSTVNGTVTTVVIGSAGNYFIITDAAGWQYWYLHVNNDTPGTDDGANPAAWILAPGVGKGTKVFAGQFVGYLGDSGNAEEAGSHLHFEIHRPDGTVINPYASLLAAQTNLPDGTWFERNGLLGGTPDASFVYGRPNDAVLACDWDGNGTDTPGSYGGGVFKLRSANSAAATTTQITYGLATDKPVCGDWDGNGTDTIGIYRNGTFFLRNENTSGVAQGVVGYGIAGDRPVIGDWDGDGRDTIGIFRGGNYYLRNSVTTGVADVTFQYGVATDQPFVGDWNGDGRDSIGIFRAGTWYLRNSNTTGIAEFTFGYGNPSDVAVPGDFDGNGADTVGVFRPHV